MAIRQNKPEKKGNRKEKKISVDPLKICKQSTAIYKNAPFDYCVAIYKTKA